MIKYAEGLYQTTSSWLSLRLTHSRLRRRNLGGMERAPRAIRKWSRKTPRILWKRKVTTRVEAPAGTTQGALWRASVDAVHASNAAEEMRRLRARLVTPNSPCISGGCRLRSRSPSAELMLVCWQLSIAEKLQAVGHLLPILDAASDE
nr:MAG: hypothetical protein [Cressdnaviricota sp.]